MYERWGKRALDVCLSGLGLILLSPVLLGLLAAGAIAFGGKPLFTQLRPGRQERLFRLVKFRSMTDERNAAGELLPDGQRLTAYGRFIRETSLDELPELWNILRGDMSLVGPRPQLVEDMMFMTDTQRQRHKIRPGLTGLAQINGRNAITWEEKLEFDRSYLTNIALWEDLRILLKTAGAVLYRRGISAAGMDTAQNLGDWLLETGKISRAFYEEKQRDARRKLEGEK